MPDTSTDRRLVLRVLFPAHWSFLLGQVALWSLVILVVTGVALALFYRPGADPVVYTGSSALYDGRELPRAFASVVRLSEDVPGGLLLRRVHRLATHVFVAALVLHLLRVVVTAGFRRPRTANYLLGVVLLLLTLGMAYTGQNLPYELLAASSLGIGFSLLSSIPFVGEELGLLVFGGLTGADSLVRLWALHVFVLPILLLAGVGLHLFLVARQSHARLPQHRGLHRVSVVAPLARSAVLGLLVLGIVLVGASLVPWSDVVLMGPALPGYASNSLAPDWYLFWPDGAMRILPALHLEIGPVVLTNVFVAGLLIPALTLAPLVLFPFLERRRRGGADVRSDELEHPFDAPVRLGLVAAGVTVFVVLSLGVTDTSIARLTRASVSDVVVVLRVLLVLAPVAVGIGTWAYARRHRPAPAGASA